MKQGAKGDGQTSNFVLHEPRLLLAHGADIQNIQIQSRTDLSWPVATLAMGTPKYERRIGVATSTNIWWVVCTVLYVPYTPFRMSYFRLGDSYSKGT